MPSGNLASQARHKSVSPKMTFASRIVVAKRGAGTSGNWTRKWLTDKDLREKLQIPNLKAPEKHHPTSPNRNGEPDFQSRMDAWGFYRR